MIGITGEGIYVLLGVDLVQRKSSLDSRISAAVIVTDHQRMRRTESRKITTS